MNTSQFTPFAYVRVELARVKSLGGVSAQSKRSYKCLPKPHVTAFVTFKHPFLGHFHIHYED